MKMRAIKSLLVMAAVAGLVATMGAQSFADFLPPSLNLPQVAGETKIKHPTTEALVGTVDWIVLSPGDYSGTVYEPFIAAVGKLPSNLDEYLYLYQVEGQVNNIVSFTIRVKGPYSSAGTFTDPYDLDIYDNKPVHDSTNFLWLAGEYDPSQTLVTPEKFKTSQNLLQWLWVDTSLDIGEETYVLYILSQANPIYGYATLKNDEMGESYKIPVPSPEPSTVVLLIMGAGIVGIVFRRQRI